MPKTIKNIYEQIVSFEKLLMAHKKARRGKREKKEVILFELNLESEILKLEKNLRERKYKPSQCKEFKIYEPKERIIMASLYTDRVVHQWYVENFIKPYFVPQFIATITKKNDIDFADLNDKKIIIYCIMSDMDMTMSFLNSLFFSFLFIKTIRKADKNDSKSLKRPLHIF